ncbi:MAG: ABC transporter substrate-binding protein [Planctomycetes bacterium]|nr:ABC transporter substrate-binding protein [Planctomycetota bacterium]
MPSATESVCRLGGGRALVACTRYCVEPAAELARVPRIGGTKNPRLDAVVALGPDLVLANAEENRPEDIDWLRARVPVLVQTPCSVDEATAALVELAARLGVPEAAAPLVREIDRILAEAAVGAPGAAPLRAFYAVWPKPWMTVNGTTFVHDLMGRIGLQNVAAAAAARYPSTSVDEVRSWCPDVVLLPSEPWAFTAADRDRLARERTFGTPVVELCDGRDFCWHGVHMAAGIRRAWNVACRLATAARARRA